MNTNKSDLHYSSTVGGGVGTVAHHHHLPHHHHPAHTTSTHHPSLHHSHSLIANSTSSSSSVNNNSNNNNSQSTSTTNNNNNNNNSTTSQLQQQQAKLYGTHNGYSVSSAPNLYNQMSGIDDHHHQNNNNNNSNNNNNNNNKNDVNKNQVMNGYNGGGCYMSQFPLWGEVEVKGFVKNISPKLWQWTHLKYLHLNDNNLMRLPPVISNLVNLVYLDASNNKIRTLPAEIGDLVSLRELYLNNNQIRMLPYEMGKLFKLTHLGLKGNPIQSDMMQIYSEPLGTQKLLTHLLDQLTFTCPPPNRRPWILLSEPQDTRNSCIFTTMCYNVLCDKYASRQLYGYCPAWALAWDYRKKAILEEIKTYSADVICLQELETEQFYNYFLPELRQYDYDGIFSPKSRAKTMSENDKKHVDGCAIFFKTSRFMLIKDYLVEFNQIAMANAEGSEDMLNRVMTKDNIGIAVLLETKHEEGYIPNGTQQKQMVLVFTAHIHWDPEYCDVKLIQTLMLTNELKQIVEQATRDYKPHVPSNDLNHIPVVICADLNSLPDSGVLEFLRTGRISANHGDFKELGYESCLQKMNTSDKSTELTHNFRLECAYDKDTMPFTNFTFDFKGIIDYIFYSRNSMRALGLLGQLDPDWYKSNKIVGFPHPHVPSDHLPLIVELELFNQPIQQQQQQQQHHQHQHQQHQQQQLINTFNRTNSSTTSQPSFGQMIPVNTNTNSPSSSSNYNNFNFLHQNNRR